MRNITTGDMMHVYGAFGEQVDYTVRLSVRMTDAVSAPILKEALKKTQQRYPYLSVRIRKNAQILYYEDNPRPVALLAQEGRSCLNAPETNFHVWAACYHDDMIHLDFFHGIIDGSGMYRVLATLLYEYCAVRYGIAKDPGILTVEDPVGPEETQDPSDDLALLSPPAGHGSLLEEAFTLETDGHLTPGPATIWDVELPEDVFMRFTSAHDASPGTIVSLLFAKAIDGLFPERDKNIVSAYVINAKPMLQAQLTHHNCLDMAVFSYTDRIKAMPLTQQCTVYRGKTFIQSDEDKVRDDMTANAIANREIAMSCKTLEEKKAAFGRMFSGGEGYFTFLVSYTGKWQHPEIGKYMEEFWLHPPNTFSLMVEIGAVNGRVFLSIQQRFKEDLVREAFLEQLRELGIPCKVRHVTKGTRGRSFCAP